ncbi:oxidoreductase C-terminal domain-containing protein [Rhodospirillum sp. A1_3_36]|uniref:oxidoreductase C-terminal domain-containing protein n=1 Tax=Rhodospirillum sp. A1_3_36 TaxID=3391666 RepID=UPI0039A6D2F2
MEKGKVSGAQVRRRTNPGGEIILPGGGDPACGSFSLFHVRDACLRAVDSVNATQDHIVARKLLTRGATPQPPSPAGSPAWQWGTRVNPRRGPQSRGHNLEM